MGGPWITWLPRFFKPKNLPSMPGEIRELGFATLAEAFERTDARCSDHSPFPSGTTLGSPWRS